MGKGGGGGGGGGGADEHMEVQQGEGPSVFLEGTACETREGVMGAKLVSLDGT